MLSLIVCYGGSLVAQEADLAKKMHDRVEKFSFADPKPKDLKEMQKDFSNHTQEELADALLNDLQSDRGVAWKNRSRDFSVGKLYKALNLPEAVVCKQLENEQSPRRKAQLMAVLWGQNTPETVKTLLHQIRDRRPAEDYIGVPEEPVEPLRVCDIACNTLIYNLTGGKPPEGMNHISFSSGDGDRDRAIERMLKGLKLNAPQ